MSDWTDGVVLVDGVFYTPAAVRQMIVERHRLATENTALRRRLEQNATHLQRRTAALVRLIARKGPRLSADG